MKLRFEVEAEADSLYLLKGALTNTAGIVRDRAEALAEESENAIADALSWKHGVAHFSVKVRRLDGARG